MDTDTRTKKTIPHLLRTAHLAAAARCAGNKCIGALVSDCCRLLSQPEIIRCGKNLISQLGLLVYWHECTFSVTLQIGLESVGVLPVPSVYFFVRFLILLPETVNKDEIHSVHITPKGHVFVMSSRNNVT